MSERKLRADVRKLRLKEGDIVLVRSRETMSELVNLTFENTPKCPIVFAPDGVHRLSKEYLQKLMERP